MEVGGREAGDPELLIAGLLLRKLVCVTRIPLTTITMIFVGS